MEPLTEQQMNALLSEVTDGAEYMAIGLCCRRICLNAEFLETTLREVDAFEKAKELGLIDDLRRIREVYSDLESVNQDYEKRWV